MPLPLTHSSGALMNPQHNLLQTQSSYAWDSLGQTVKHSAHWDLPHHWHQSLWRCGQGFSNFNSPQVSLMHTPKGGNTIPSQHSQTSKSVRITTELVKMQSSVGLPWAWDSILSANPQGTLMLPVPTTLWVTRPHMIWPLPTCYYSTYLFV